MRVNNEDQNYVVYTAKQWRPPHQKKWQGFHNNMGFDARKPDFGVSDREFQTSLLSYREKRKS